MEKKIVQTSGKRKTAIAKAVIREGTGKVRINKFSLDVIQPEIVRMKIIEPLLLAGELAKKVDIDIVAKGGGFMGQAEAIRTAIGRGLVEFFGDTKLRDIYMEYDRTILKGDSRRAEPKKYGGRGARARRQKSYR